MGISQPTVSRIVKMIACRIAELAPRYIRFPEPQEEEQLMRQFHELAQFPGVIGCIDGTHIPIISPGGDNPEIYRCRKGFYSLNIQGVCDANMKFTNSIASWPGSVHDSRMFAESLVSEKLNSLDYKGYLLGDNGYPCRTYILTPFLSPGTEKERRYNCAHIKTRNTIERAFGVLKRRFAILSTPMRTKLENSKKIVMACAILHNIAIENKLPIDEPEFVQFDPPEVPEQEHMGNVQGGNARRSFIVDNFF